MDILGIGLLIFALACVVISLFVIFLNPGKFILGNQKESKQLTPQEERKFERNI